MCYFCNEIMGRAAVVLCKLLYYVRTGMLCKKLEGRAGHVGRELF
jgi:hypothetical protein